MSIMEYNGGAVVAMAGKECVAIACDKRLGMQALTVTNNFPKIFGVNDQVYYGLTGLASDVLTVSESLKYKTSLYKLEENREIGIKAFSHLISAVLYEKRFGPYFIEPVIAGLDPTSGEPFICSADLIGCLNFAKDFVVSGVTSPSLFGMCESLWEPDLGPDELFETISQALVNALDRDALSGWGADVYVITKKQVVKKILKSRQD